MPDSLNIGRNAAQVTMSPIFDAVSGIRMIIDDETEISKGNESGYVFEIQSPYATDAQAQWLYNKLKGIEYQPFTAESAILNPAAELGDYITTYGVFGGLFSERIKFQTVYAADIGAPQDSTIDHEYPYETAADRKFVRKMKEIAAEFEIQAQEISAKVSQVGGNNQSFGWSMTTDGMFWYANGSEIMRATQAGLKVIGEINATSGVIGGASIINGTLTVQNANIQSINGSKVETNTLNGNRIVDNSIQTAKYGSGSVSGGSGGAIGSGTISTFNTGSGINTSLGYADFANGVFNGWNTATTVQASSVVVQGHQYTPGTISFIDGNGNLRSFSTLLT